MKKTLLFLSLIISLHSNSQCWNKIAPGYGHSLGVMNDGSLWAWGFNSLGELGNSSMENENSPIQIGTENNWSSIASGYSHSVAIKSDGTLWAWGYNGYGQLGDGTLINKSIPTQIGSENTWLKVDCGDFQTLAIKSDGSLWAWGFNQYGILGTGNQNNVSVPTQVGNEFDWLEISVGISHALAIKNNHTLWAWGNNAQGALGIGTTVLNSNSPISVTNETTWQKISAGFLHSLAIKSDGSIWSWGYNEYGQLGDNSFINKNFPSQIGDNNNWIDISAGSGHSIGIQSTSPQGTQTLWTWGKNTEGQLGNGSSESSSIPTLVTDNYSWKDVEAGWSSSMAISTGEIDNSQLFSWGFNIDGQLGLGNNINVYTMNQVSCEALSVDKFLQNENCVYPNPTNGILNIYGVSESSNLNINVLDQVGKTLKTIRSQTSIDVSDLASGIYLLAIEKEGVVKYKKFIKK